MPLYAKGGIPELWVVDLEGRRVLVHREPQGEAYREVRTLHPGDTLVHMGVEIPVEEIL
ncbi:MAG: Uma2 family endonuclease [Thermus sp.]